MEKTDPTPRDKASFIDKSVAKAPCVLLLDVSSSMSGKRIEELCAGLAVYQRSLALDEEAAKRVEVAVVAFGGEVQTLCDFASIQDFHPPQLIARGDVPLGAAIHQGIDLLQDRKQAYWSNRVAFHRPWVFLISAGAPTDLWHSAAGRIRYGESSKGFSLFAVGVEGADFGALRELTIREPLRLHGLRFRDLFRWLADSQCAVSRSAPEDRVLLQNPAAPGGWAASGPGGADPQGPKA